MQQTICDICGEVIRRGHEKRGFALPNRFSQVKIETGRGDYLSTISVEIAVEHRPDLCESCWQKACLVGLKMLVQKLRHELRTAPEKLEYRRGKIHGS